MYTTARYFGKWRPGLATGSWDWRTFTILITWDPGSTQIPDKPKSILPKLILGCPKWLLSTGKWFWQSCLIWNYTGFGLITWLFLPWLGISNFFIRLQRIALSKFPLKSYRSNSTMGQLLLFLCQTPISGHAAWGSNSYHRSELKKWLDHAYLAQYSAGKAI